MATATGQFYIANGGIIDPNGNNFVARGIDVAETGPSADTLQQDFPGINFVRLAIYDYASPDTLQAYVNDLTSHGIVVELEDHTNGAGDSGGSRGVIYSGQQLDNELSWYSSIASAFQSNPLVWFGTNNEPSETDSSGNNDPAALSDWQKATYDAIRNAGNNSPILLEANGWTNNGQVIMNQGYNPADYASMTNVVWDAHYYGWWTNGSTDQATNNDCVAQIIQQAQQITSADGIVPVMFGEYGNSTTGTDIDSNAAQVLQAVQNSGAGNVAWYWGQGNPGDGLVNADGSLSSYGQEVAGSIAAQAAQNPGSPLPVSPPTTPTTGITSFSSTSTITLNMSEDAWQGDAQFTVSVDGQPVGGTYTASALHGTGDDNVFNLTGNWDSGAHQVAIQFINDAYGGSPSMDRNLYVDSIAFNGVTASGSSAPLDSNGTASFSVGGDTQAANGPADTVTLHLAEDAWNGNAQFVLLLDGQAVTTPQDVVASYAGGAWEDLSFSGNFGAGSHTIGVEFTNDAYGGSPDTDRNLYVNGIDVNGTHYGSGVTALMGNGTADFGITTAA